MAETSGTATSYLDLLADLVTFLTGLGGGEAWTVEKNTTSSFTVDGEVYLHGPGLTGTDDVYVTIATSGNAGTGVYIWTIQGAVGFDTLLARDDQAGAIPLGTAMPVLPLVAGSMTYQFVANGRRFAGFAMAGSVCESFYCGFIEAYGSPSEWPYPLFIGACHKSSSALSSDVTTAHHWFSTNSITSDSQVSNACLRGPGGIWARLCSWNLGATLNSAEQKIYVVPTGIQDTAHVISKNEVSNYPILDCQIFLHDTDWTSGDGSDFSNFQRGNKCPVGRLDGVFWTTGHLLTHGDTITESGDDYLAFQDTFRSGVADFQLLKLV